MSADEENSNLVISSINEQHLEQLLDGGGFLASEEGSEEILFAPAKMIYDEQPIPEDIRANGEVISSISLSEDTDPVAILVLCDGIHISGKELVIVPLEKCSNITFPIDVEEQQEVVVILRGDCFYARGGSGELSW